MRRSCAGFQDRWATNLPVPSDWWTDFWWLILVAGHRVERSLRLFKPTLSPDQIQPAI